MANLLTKSTSILKPKRRWVQLSMRSLLVLMTILCVALSAWVVPAERQRRAVAAIEALDGSVRYDEQTGSESEAFTSRCLRRWLPRDYLLDRVDAVVFSRGKRADEGLAHLRALNGLRRLEIGGTQVTDTGLVALQGLTALQEIYLHETGITDAGLANLRALHGLRKLFLWDTQITDK